MKVIKIPEKEMLPVSPLKGVGPLLKFYSYIGAFPARIDKKYSEFQISWLRYAIALAIVIILNVLLYLIPELLGFEDGLEQNPTQTMLDQVFGGLHMKLQVVCSVFVIILNHKQIGRLSSLVEKYSLITVTNETPILSAKNPLMHHTIVLLMYALASPVMGLAYCHGYDAYMSAFAAAQGPVIVMVLEVLKMLNYVFITIFITIQELIIDRFLQVLAWYLNRFTSAKYLEKASTSILCKDLKACLDAFHTLSVSTGGILFVFVSFSSLQLLFCAYYFCVFFLELDNRSASMDQPAKAMMWVSQAVLCVAYSKRMLHMAHSAHAVEEGFGQAVETLIVMEGKPDTNTLEVKSLRKLLQRVGSLPVKGFFSVNRSMVLIMWGQIATYLIIMLEFKNEDMSNNKTPNTSWTDKFMSAMG